METETKTATPAQAIAELGLTVESTFIPLSQSRNKGAMHPSLNWRVTLKRNGRAVIATDYSAGCAHAPSYKQHWGKRTVESAERDEMVAWECEHGRKAIGVRYGSRGCEAYGAGAGPHLAPKATDVVYSLVQDGSAIDEGGFDEWAASLGYDTDSRKAEAAYRACVETGLKLRAALGEDGLAKLRDAFQDY
jgi:hypothetical protein